MEGWKKRKKYALMLVIFFAFLLICSLIAKGIYAAGLPQVETALPIQRSITHTFSFKGSVVQSKECAQHVDSGLRVKEIFVRQGDTVETGDVLFRIDLEDVKEQMENLSGDIQKLQLQIRDLESGIAAAEMEKQTGIERAGEDIFLEMQTADNAVARAGEDLEKAQEKLEEHREDHVDVTPEDQRNAARTEYEDWENMRQQLERAAADAEELYENTKKEQAQKEAELEELLQALEAEADGEEEPTEAETGEETEAPTEANAGEETETEAREELKTRERKEDSVETQPMPDTLSDEDLQARIGQAKKELEEAYRKTEEAETALEAARKALEKHMENAVMKPDYSGEDAAASAWENVEDNLETAVKSAERSLQDSQTAREKAQLQGERRMEDAASPDRLDSTLEICQINLKALQKEYEAYRKVVEEEGNVACQTAGILTALNVSVGERTADGPAVKIADMNSPFLFQTSLSRETKEYIAQKDEGILILGGDDTERKVTLDYLTENAYLPETYDAAVMLPEGSGKIGETGTLTIKKQTETFKSCVPAEALHKDSAGKDFIYILEQKSGILGVRYIVKALRVTVLNRNETYAAIDSALMDEKTEVVITYTGELKDGAVVRYKEW